MLIVSRLMMNYLDFSLIGEFITWVSVRMDVALLYRGSFILLRAYPLATEIDHLVPLKYLHLLNLAKHCALCCLTVGGIR